MDLEENGKESKAKQNTFCLLSQSSQKNSPRLKVKNFGTEEYMKGKIETICQICEIPKPFFEQKTDCVLLNAQLKRKGLVIEIYLATQVDWIGLLTEDNFENKKKI